MNLLLCTLLHRKVLINNGAIKDKFKSMLSNATLTKGFWAQGEATTIRLINQSPSRVLDKEQWQRYYEQTNRLPQSISESLATRHLAMF